MQIERLMRCSWRPCILTHFDAHVIGFTPKKSMENRLCSPVVTLCGAHRCRKRQEWESYTFVSGRVKMVKIRTYPGRRPHVGALTASGLAIPQFN